MNIKIESFCKKLLCMTLSLTFIACISLSFTGCQSNSEYKIYNKNIIINSDNEPNNFEGATLNITSNFGDFILADVITEFENKYKCEVIYSECESNEHLYSVLSESTQDLVIASDYMIDRLSDEDMLRPLNFDNIPNYENIGEEYKNLPYDPDNTYSVPYTWGVVALCYNEDMFKGEVNDFSALWSKENKGNILMFNNSRDAMAIAMQRLGLDPEVIANPTKEDIDKACELLKEQKPLVQKYVMDQVYDLMESNQASIAPYYAGDIYYMMDNNDSLGYALPEDGTNFFVDAMCIPKNAENPELAEAFINFMLEPEIGASNSLYIGYASPNSEAVALLPEDIRNNKLIYPDKEYLDKCYMYVNTPADIYDYMQTKFIEASTD